MALALVRNIAADCDQRDEEVRIFIITCTKGKATILNKFRDSVKKHVKDESWLKIGAVKDLCDELNIDIREDYSYHDKYNKWPELIQRISLELSEAHPDTRLVLFVDEIMPFGNPASLDWRNLESHSSMNIFLAFSPVGQDRNKVLKIVEHPEPWSAANEEQFILPNPHHSGFVHCPLTLRYRNTVRLQRLTSAVGRWVGKYADTGESPGIDVEGEKMKWFELGVMPDTQRVLEAVMKVKNMLIDRRISPLDAVVLYDKDIDCHKLESIRKLFHGSGHNWKQLEIIEERLYHGCESNTVLYLGAGHMEALTRAQVNLFVISWSENAGNPWYRAYQDALTAARDDGNIDQIT